MVQEQVQKLLASSFSVDELERLSHDARFQTALERHGQTVDDFVRLAMLGERILAGVETSPSLFEI